MTVASFDPKAQVVTMTESALKHFRNVLAGKEDKLVRLSTKESGCTGYAYVLDLVDQAEAEDVVLQPDGAITLAVDVEAMKLLHGTEIDYVNEGVNSVLKFKNPNVVAECGCGESFSVG